MRQAWRIETPAGKRHHPVRGEVLEIIAHGVDGIQVVLRKRERAGGGGSPGIDQRGLQHLKAIRAAAHEGAAVLDVDVHVGAQI